jgi:small subunit ribosomal protein S15
MSQESSATNSEKNSGLSGLDRAEVVKRFAVKIGDTGSPEVQVAILTSEIEKVASHAVGHPLDLHSQRGMLMKISKRKKLLSYLKGESLDRYKNLITSLGLRK